MMQLVNARGMSEALENYKEEFEEVFVYPLESMIISKYLEGKLELPKDVMVNQYDNKTLIHKDNKGFLIKKKDGKIILSQVKNVVDAQKYIKFNEDSYLTGYPVEVEYANKSLKTKYSEGLQALGTANTLEKEKNLVDISKLSRAISTEKLVDLIYPDMEILKKLRVLAQSAYEKTLNEQEGLQNHNETFEVQLKKLFIYAKGKTLEKPFVFNDLDNGFYINRKKITLYNQNYQYHLTQKEGLYHIKSYSKPSEYEEPLGQNDFQFDERNNKLTINKLENPFVLSHFMIDLEGAIESYEAEHDLKKEKPEIVKSYEYYLAYHHKEFQTTKEDCIFHILFYGFPGGGQKDGNFSYDERETLPYLKSVEKMVPSIHETIAREKFNCPVVYRGNVDLCAKIKTVNASWTRMFQDALEMVQEFIQRYENADKVQKMTMFSFADSQKYYDDLKKFIPIAQGIIERSQKNLDIKIPKNKLH